MRPGVKGRNIDGLRLAYDVDVDTCSGAARLRLPVPAPPGREGLGPKLTLGYASGGGNSAFGAGWSLDGLPEIRLDTRFHVPRWDGLDGYQIGGDELVPWLEQTGGTWTPRGFVDGDWSVAFLRTRRGSGHVRVEKWVNVATGRVHFRTRDERNLVTVYGARPNAAARIADPADETRTLSWLPELQIDPTGNLVWFDYAAETLDGVDLTAPYERRQPSLAQRYLKRVLYGNVTPLALDDALLAGTQPAGVAWCFQLVLDYGDHSDPNLPSAIPDRAWPARQDPFSIFRNGFEVRTNRLCRRLLSYHQFAELGAQPTLVAALGLTHDEDPAGSTLIQIAQTGYRVDGGSMTSAAIPPLRMTYAPAMTDLSFTDVPALAQENLPAGLLGAQLTFVDLRGEGLSGMLTESDRSWYYKPNLGGGEFGAQAMVLERPATRPGAFSFGDINSDGDTDLSQLGGRLAGLYELDREIQVWRPFRSFLAFPHVEALGGRAEWVDLNGDGRPDILVAKEDAFVWFASDGDSFRPPVEIPRPTGADAPPATTSNPGLDFFFADMNGDGLADLVRLQHGRVEYWPSLGNGYFGGAVVMDGAPEFAPNDAFDPGRLRFVDLDGSGTTDIVYLGRGEVTSWINASGNELIAGPKITSLPYLDSVSSMRVLDFLGDGSACLVWSSPLPGHESPLEYLPLAPALKPRLLLSVDDSLGRQTSLTYSSSATHYLRDMASGRDWSTKLPKHHPVVDRREVFDQIGNTRLVQRFAYHDGYYDGEEREQRGFAQVDVYDAEAVDGTAPGPTAAAFTAPSLTRSWFHMGTDMWGSLRPTDAYAGDAALPCLQPHMLDGVGGLTACQVEDGLRALAGRTIRRELYAVGADDVPVANPFEVYQASFRLVCHQPANGPDKPAFSVVSLEDATWTYEQAAGDPRVTHRIVLETDAYDAPILGATIGYARRAGRPPDVPSQAQNTIGVDRRSVVNVDEQDRYELAIASETRSVELVGVLPGPTGLFTRDQLNAPPVAAALAAPSPHYMQPDPSLGPGARLFAWGQRFYWNDGQTAALPLGQLGALTLIHHDETACFAHAFAASVWGPHLFDPLLASRLTALFYVERGDLWWKAGAVQQFAPAAQFYLPLSTLRADGAATAFVYDGYAIAVTQSTDALGNVTAAIIDYCQLAPSRVVDPNGNVTEVRYDPLGVVVASTTYGTVAGQPWGFAPLATVSPLMPPALAAALASPGRYLQGAAHYTWYDLGAWSASGVPTPVLELTAEQLLHDGAGGGTPNGRIQVDIAYLDGLGRLLQSKTLVEDGPAIQRDAQGAVVVDVGGAPVLAPASPRWRASGHIVYDTKGHQGCQYDPFFSPSAAYEGDDVLQHFGVSTLAHYDAVGRSLGMYFPNGTFTSTTYGAWTGENADPNDNVAGSVYGALRLALPSGSAELEAYQEALPHAGTTTLSYVDPRGRQVGSLAKGGSTAADRRIETQLDIAGAVLRVIDPRNLSAFTYQRDMARRPLHQVSVDDGEAWSMPDAFDRIVTSWDGRGFQIDRGYDLGDRPISTDVSGGDGTAPLKNRVEQWVYGETLGRVAAAARNLLGRVLTASDSAGQVTVDRYDPPGLAMSSTRSLRVNVDTEPDWLGSEPLEPDTYTTTALHDALGRPTTDTLPDKTIRAFDYLPSGPLSQVRVTTPDGGLSSAPILVSTAYGALGERLKVALGNGVQVAYSYDPQTHRLATQTATLGTKALQGLQYTYDPVGNLVRLVDTAQQGPSPLISGMTAPARRDYACDAHYRLLTATGRVHQALLQNDYVPNAAGTFMGTRSISFNDGTAIEPFTERYTYDASGNLLSLKHFGQTQSWTTAMWVSPGSNRSLLAVDPTTGIPVSNPESQFDLGGNVIQLAQLRAMQWTFRGALARAVVIRRPGGTDDDERYIYGADGMRVRKVTTRVVNGGRIEVTEKAYFGNSERKRITLGGTLILERWTTHVSDGGQRVALLYRWDRDTLAREVDNVATLHVHYELNTHQRSSAIEIDQNGDVISYEEYFPYGGTAFIAGNYLRKVSLKEYRYSGKECDGFTGLYYYGYRYYAPWMGRWLSPDPIGPEDGLNLYEFVHGNCVTLRDDSGLLTRAEAILPGDTTVGTPHFGVKPNGKYWETRVIMRDDPDTHILRQYGVYGEYDNDDPEGGSYVVKPADEILQRAPPQTPSTHTPSAHAHLPAQSASPSTTQPRSGAHDDSTAPPSSSAKAEGETKTGAAGDSTGSSASLAPTPPHDGSPSDGSGQPQQPIDPATNPDGHQPSTATQPSYGQSRNSQGSQGIDESPAYQAALLRLHTYEGAGCIEWGDVKAFFQGIVNSVPAFINFGARLTQPPVPPELRPYFKPLELPTIKIDSKYGGAGIIGEAVGGGAFGEAFAAAGSSVARAAARGLEGLSGLDSIGTAAGEAIQSAVSEELPSMARGEDWFARTTNEESAAQRVVASTKPGQRAEGGWRVVAGRAVKPRVATATKYVWRNPRMPKGNFIEAELDANGALEITVKSRGPDELRVGGSQMLDDVFEHFGADNIREFDAKWVRNSSFRDNFDKYVQNLQEGMAPQEAAWNTWTGRYLKAPARGFTSVEVPVHGADPEIVQPVFKK